MGEKWERLGQWKGKGGIYCCPGNLIHLAYGNLTIRFGRDEFLEFAWVVSEAAAVLMGGPPPTPLGRLGSKTAPRFSVN